MILLSGALPIRCLNKIKNMKTLLLPLLLFCFAARAQATDSTQIKLVQDFLRHVKRDTAYVYHPERFPYLKREKLYAAALQWWHGAGGPYGGNPDQRIKDSLLKHYKLD